MTNDRDKLDYFAEFFGFIFVFVLIVSSYLYLSTQSTFFFLIYTIILTYFILSFFYGNYILAIFTTYNYEKRKDIIKDIKKHSKINISFLLYNFLLLIGLLIPFLFNDIIFKGLSVYIILNLIYQTALQFNIYNKYIKNKC